MRHVRRFFIGYACLVLALGSVSLLGGCGGSEGTTASGPPSLPATPVATPEQQKEIANQYGKK